MRRRSGWRRKSLNRLKKEAVPILIIVVAGIIIVLGFIFREFLNANLGAGATVATGLLVMITGLYGWHARQTANANKRMAEIM